MLAALRSLRALALAPRFAGTCAVGLLAALVVVFLWPTLIGGKVFSNGDVIFTQGPWSNHTPPSFVRPSNPLITDQTYEFNPDLIVTRRALAGGQLDLWNPYQGAGRPLLASLQQAPLFPPNLLSLIVPFWHSLAWVAALKLLLGALGLYLLARWNALARGPAVLAGVTYAFCAYTVSWLASPIAASIVMTPWVMLMAGRLARDGGIANALGVSASVALLILGGHPETVFFALVASAGWCGCELIGGRAGRAGPGSAPGARPALRRRIALLAAAVIAGISVSAVTLIPFAELLRAAGNITRAGGPFGNNIAYSFAFPELWGNPTKAIGALGPINYSERTAYLGALPLLLAVGGVVAWRPRGRHLFWIVFTALALLIAMATPLHTFVAGLPVADRTNILRGLFLVMLGASLLAGFGLQAWLDGGPRVRRRMLIAMLATALLPVVVLLRNTSPVAHLGDALGQLPSLSGHLITRDFIKQAVAWRWMLFAAAGIAALALSGRLPRRLVCVGAVLLVAVDLMTLDRGYNPSLPLSYVDPPMPPAITYLRSHHGHQRISGTGSPQGFALVSNLAERYGLPDIQTYDLPKPARWMRLWTGLGQQPVGQNAIWDDTAARAHAVLDVFAASYALLPPGAPAPRWLKPVFREGDELVVRNPTALPRAWVAYSWRRASGEDAALSETLSSSTAQLLRSPVLERVTAPSAGGGAAVGAARFVTDQDEHVVLQVASRRAGYLVLDDTFYPGWQATVDGRATSIVAANEAFRAVAVPAGRHLVSFRYRPASATAGAAVSLVSLSGLLLLGLGGALRRRGSQGRA